MTYLLPSCTLIVTMQIHIRIKEPLATKLTKENEKTGVCYTSLIKIALADYLKGTEVDELKSEGIKAQTHVNGDLDCMDNDRSKGFFGRRKGR